MAGGSSIHHELNALRMELGKRFRPDAEAARHETTSDDADDGGSSFAANFEEQLNELSKALSEYTGSTEDFIAEHPLASVLGAFVLGVAVGRMMGRS